ncbi:hypothetical protein niasHT_035868 [Heterodera trifolii]|uniref:Uncharacterized protein n=1 Tax=Heterodera trifolii TaxID=157864 RepID=A0ABD2IA91_9BILA
MQIPQNPLPKKVVGFEAITIRYINDNVITFLRCFRPLFAACQINLAIVDTLPFIVHTLDSILRNIWPMIATNICAIQLSAATFSRLRHFVPSILDECPSLRVIDAYYNGFFAEFPCDDSAAASNGQTVAKWLFTPRPDNVPKVFKCWLQLVNGVHLESSIEAFKREFTNASSPVNFIAIFRFPPTFADSVLLFNLTNGFTHEQLTLTWMNDIGRFLLIRCPIVRDESKWTKWEKEAIGWQFYGQWNRIDIHIS